MAPERDMRAASVFLRAAMRAIAGRDVGLAVLDFGCGSGGLVQDLALAGIDAFGCDLPGVVQASERLKEICLDPYRLPFGDGTFDVVVSTNVLEHAQNKTACFREIHRVLRPGGYAMHLYPGKWYLPTEPHIHVPLVSWLWPRCPRWWLAIWARLGVRNEFQTDRAWREVTELNDRYCREGLSYWSNGHYRRLSNQVFGNCAWPTRFYVDHADGGAAILVRRLPLKGLFAPFLREVREAFLVQEKT
jgi:SAM-dependent methyltransferase